MNFHLWLLLAPVWVGLGAGWVLGVAACEAATPLGGGAALLGWAGGAACEYPEGEGVTNAPGEGVCMG